MPPPDGRFVTEATLRIRYAEVDAMQIVHHSRYIVFFEEGRSDYARKRGHPYSEIERGGIYLLVTEVHVRFHKPARYEDLIIVRTWIDEIKSRGMTFCYEVVNADSGELLVTGNTNHICVSQHDGKIARVPDAWREWMYPPN